MRTILFFVATTLASTPVFADAALYGAIAYDPKSQSMGYSTDQFSQLDAENFAAANCDAEGCKALFWFGGCGALARAKDGKVGYGYGENRALSEKGALDDCAKQSGKTCELVTWACNSGYGTEAYDPNKPATTTATVTETAVNAEYPADVLAKLSADAQLAAADFRTAVLEENAELFLDLVPKAGIKAFGKKLKKKAIGDAIASKSVSGWVRFAKDVPWVIEIPAKKKGKEFTVYAGSGYGETPVVVFKLTKKVWQVAEVKIVDMGSP